MSEEPVRDLIPSTPAVFLPAFSCDTCRTASNLAAVDFRISFCRFFARTVSPSRIALNNLVCRRNRLRRIFFQGSFLQSSLSLLGLCLTILYSRNRFLIASTQLRAVLPRIREFRFSSSLPRFSTFPETLILFLFVPSVRLFVPLDVANSTIGNPWSYRYSVQIRRVCCSDEVRGCFLLSCLMLSRFFRLGFIMGTP
jgi:hypothetical protein